MSAALSPQMEKLLGLMEPGHNYTEMSIQAEFYGVESGRYGYVHAGRGRGTGSLRGTFVALERRGLVERTPYGWRLSQPTEGVASRGSNEGA